MLLKKKTLFNFKANDTRWTAMIAIDVNEPKAIAEEKRTNR